MDDLFPGDLGCTANDIQISGVAKNPDGTEQIVITDPCAFPGDSVTFTATFDVVTTAKRRHDIGIYFAIDGDPNDDGALTGTCSISTMPYQPDPPWLDLDGTDDDPLGVTQDLCGDIDKPGHNPLNPAITITAICQDDDGDGFLNLPNCTSWRQFGANELCTDPTDAFPGSPSKCRCDQGFNVPVPVPPASLAVTKTPSGPPCDPAQEDTACVDEPSGDVTFDVTVTNTGADPNNKVTLDFLNDDIYGDITQPLGDIVSTNCAVPQTICPDVPTAPCDIEGGEFSGTYSCSFTATVAGDAGDSETDTVTASGVDDNGNTVAGDDTANVDVLDVAPEMSVVKTADPTSVLEPGADVTFSVVVNNLSVSSDELTLTALDDDIYGDITLTAGDIVSTTCSVPQTIAADGSYSCLFVAPVTGNAVSQQTDTVTATANDDEGNSIVRSASADVDIVDVAAMCELSKVASPATFDESLAGTNVTFTVTIDNTSGVDDITINSLIDDPHGDLNGQGSCSVPQTLTPTGPDSQYTCSFTANVTGEGNTSETDTVVATGVDDDLPNANAVGCSGSATVNIIDVPPSALLIKTATMVTATFEVEVTNTSEVDVLTLDALVDDKFCDITTAHPATTDPDVCGEVVSTTCSTTDVSIAIGGTYMCSFEGKINASPHTDTVTGTVSDNEGGSVTPSDSANVTFD